MRVKRRMRELEEQLDNCRRSNQALLKERNDLRRSVAVASSGEIVKIKAVYPDGTEAVFCQEVVVGR